jgi:hypothetical protein
MRTLLTRVLRNVVLMGFLLAPVPFLMGAAAPTSYGSSAEADLKHAPTGATTLTWNAQTHVLRVVIALTGLAPKSTHPAHIHLGSCTDNDPPIKYMLYPVVADASGNGGSTTIIYGVTGGIPSSGWAINVHNGPGLTKSSYPPSNQYLPIACGNLVNGYAYANRSQAVRATLHFTKETDQSALGASELWVSNHTLYMRVSAVNLQPGSRHMAHVHYGSCTAQGGIAYNLVDLHADGMGVATSTTAIHGVGAIPSHGWYINVHLGVGNELNNQTGFDPILCGNVMLA